MRELPPIDGDRPEHGGDDRRDPAHAALHAALCGLTDGLRPPADPMAAVRRRAARIRARRRMARATSATAALAFAITVGPTLIGELRHSPGNEVAAAPPAAVLDLTVAYPQPVAGAPATAQQAAADTAPSVPVNALNWPARGPELPREALDLARDYLLTEGRSPDEDGKSDDAEVHQLWARYQPDRKTWLYVVQGWTSGPDGVNTAEILTGEYDAEATARAKAAAGAKPGTAEPQPARPAPTGQNLAVQASQTTQAAKAVPKPAPVTMSVYSETVRYTHPAPGMPAEPDATARIAEYAVWLPEPNQLLVLGAPQVETVLYAKDGKRYVAQPTEDGVALFQRAKVPAKGGAVDLVQVRDDRNQALTPPVGWTTPDLSMTGPGATYVATGGWSGVPGEDTVDVPKATTPPPGHPAPVTAPTVPPATPSRTGTGRTGNPTPPAGSPPPTDSGSGTGGVTAPPTGPTSSGGPGTAAPNANSGGVTVPPTGATSSGDDWVALW